MPDEQRTRNNAFSLSGVVFTEIPLSPMRSYPSDWESTGIFLFPLNGFGDQEIVLDGTWSVIARMVGDKQITTADSSTIGDSAVYEYLGYGFQLSMLQGPAFGKVAVYLDDVQLETVDLYADTDQGPSIVYEQPKVSRDFHRVKIVIRDEKNDASSGYAASWHALRVIA